eukprot:g326.t1
MNLITSNQSSLSIHGGALPSHLPADRIRVYCKLHSSLPSVIECDDGKTLLFNNEEFQFDSYLSPSLPAASTFNRAGKQTIDEVLNGFNSTILTFGGEDDVTMNGSSFDFDTEDRGVLPRSLEYLFSQISKRSENYEYNISCSYIFICNEVIYDLLAYDDDDDDITLCIRENNHGEVEGASRAVVSDIMSCLNVAQKGKNKFLDLNLSLTEKSSGTLSLIVQIARRSSSVVKVTSKMPKIQRSTLLLVNVGNGNTEKSDLSKKSLENCIISKTFDNLCDSKLTRLLQNTLMGRCCTSFIVSLSDNEIDNQDKIFKLLNFGRFARQIAVRKRFQEAVDYKSLYMRQQKRLDFMEKKVKLSENEIIKWKNISEKLEQERDKVRSQNESLKSQLKVSEETISNLENGVALESVWKLEKESMIEAHTSLLNSLRIELEQCKIKGNKKMNENENIILHLEDELKQTKETLLETLQNFSKMRIKMLEQEKEKDARVNDLLDEVREKESQINEVREKYGMEKKGVIRVVEEVKKREEIIQELQNKVKTEYVDRNKVSEMGHLFEDVIEKLEKRVERVEKVKIQIGKKNTRRNPQKQIRNRNKTKRAWGVSSSSDTNSTNYRKPGVSRTQRNRSTFRSSLSRNGQSDKATKKRKESVRDRMKRYSTRNESIGRNGVNRNNTWTRKIRNSRKDLIRLKSTTTTTHNHIGIMRERRRKAARAAATRRIFQ